VTESVFERVCARVCVCMHTYIAMGMSVCLRARVCSHTADKHARVHTRTHAHTKDLDLTAAYCNTRQHTATHGNTHTKDSDLIEAH